MVSPVPPGSDPGLEQAKDRDPTPVIPRWDSHWQQGPGLQYVTAEWEPAFLRQAREFLFFPLIPREARK